MRYVVCTFIVLICTTLGAQDLRARPQFEVATVKPALRGQIDPYLAKALQEQRRNPLRAGDIGISGAGRVHLQDWPLLDLIAAAYIVRAPTQVSGPAWLSDNGFDIEARVPDGTSEGDLNAMLQALLEERFALRVHRTTQTKQGYAITVGKGGPKLTPAKLLSDPSAELSEQEQKALAMQSSAVLEKALEHSKSGTNFAFFSWSSITLEQLAHQLERFTEAPVVDATGLTGTYSVAIEMPQNPDDWGSTIFDVVEKLGLKLERREVPVDILVVDQVSKVPTPN
jgi:uncharacterized protein (TIGR03435 family)